MLFLVHLVSPHPVIRRLPNLYKITRSLLITLTAPSPFSHSQPVVNQKQWGTMLWRTLRKPNPAVLPCQLFIGQVSKTKSGFSSELNKPVPAESEWQKSQVSQEVRFDVLCPTSPEPVYLLRLPPVLNPVIIYSIIRMLSLTKRGRALTAVSLIHIDKDMAIVEYDSDGNISNYNDNVSIKIWSKKISSKILDPDLATDHSLIFRQHVQASTVSQRSHIRPRAKDLIAYVKAQKALEEAGNDKVSSWNSPIVSLWAFILIACPLSSPGYLDYNQGTLASKCCRIR